MINTLSKQSGVEVPNELEETLKEMSIHSSRREGKSDYLTNSIDDSSIESSIQQVKTENDYLSKAVKDKLRLYKSRKENRLEEVIQENLKNLQSEFKIAEIEGVGKGKTGEEVFKILEKGEEEKFEEYDMSAEKGPADSSNMLIEQIKELHKEIYLIQNRIERSEQDLRKKEVENKELKDIIERLNDSYEKIGDGTESGGGCQNCGLM